MTRDKQIVGTAGENGRDEKTSRNIHGVVKNLVLFIFVGLISQLITIPSQAVSSCRLTTNQADIQFTNLSPITIRINKTEPSNNECRYLYFNDNLASWGLGGQHEGLSAVGFPQTNEPFFDVTFRPSYPYKNGFHQIKIKQQGGEELVVTVSINLDYRALGLYTVDFSLDCDDPKPDREFQCTISPEIGGELRQQVKGEYMVDLSYRVKGQTKWIKEEKFNWDINEGVVLTLFKTTKPVEVRAVIDWEEKRYSLNENFVPSVKVQFTLPGAATVGKSFEIRARTISQYTANCVVIGTAGSRSVTNRFKITKGVGRVSLYGPVPGELKIQVMCAANDFSDVNQMIYTYIRR